MDKQKKDKPQDNAWMSCTTMRELGSLERPPIRDWLRHLATAGHKGLA